MPPQVIGDRTDHPRDRGAVATSSAQAARRRRLRGSKPPPPRPRRPGCQQRDARAVGPEHARGRLAHTTGPVTMRPRTEPGRRQNGHGRGPRHAQIHSTVMAAPPRPQRCHRTAASPRLSAALPGAGVMPCYFASVSRNSRPASAALRALVQLGERLARRRLGATITCQPPITTGTPCCSASVGTSVALATRSAVLTPAGASRPERACGTPPTSGT